MDTLAHTLWAAAGATAVHRRRPMPRRTRVTTLVLAALPDLLHLLPIVGWWLLAGGSWAVLQGYVVAVPGQEPALPAQVQFWSHTLHCVMHSAPVAALVTGALWPWRRACGMPLLGWWSHIVADVFTHSADYYAVPVLYPFTQRGFDGIAWTSPWFMGLNYLALAGCGWGLWRTRGA